MVKLGSENLLTIGDLSREEVLALVKRAAVLKTGWNSGTDRPRPLKDKTVALVFEKASTRTRVSFEVAISQLEGHSLFMTSRDSQLGREEPLKDMARVMSRYVDCLVVRTYGQEVVKELALFADIPVINALTDRFHPCQVLSDLLTVCEQFGADLSGLTYAWLGDGNNMAHSWIVAAGKLGFRLQIASPSGYQPDSSILEAARQEGGEIVLGRDPREAVDGAQVISTDVWASMGQEQEAAGRVNAFRGFTLDDELLDLAAPDARVLHCLPAHRGEEISDAVMEGPRSVVWVQAENRLHMQKAILEALLG